MHKLRAKERRREKWRNFFCEREMELSHQNEKKEDTGEALGSCFQSGWRGQFGNFRQRFL